jgi:hypothetical protein
MTRRFSRSSLLVPVAAMCGIALASHASADMTLVSRVTAEGGAAPSPAQTVTTSYRGGLIRTETGRVVTLYNTTTQTITTLNKMDKTYRVLPLNSAFSQRSGLLSRVKISSSADIQPQDESKVIAGMRARKYAGKVVMKMTVEGMSDENAPQTTMEIEQWTTDAVPLPADAQQIMSPVMRLSGPLQKMEGMKPLVEALSRMKGAPLSSKVKVIPASRPGRPVRPPVTTTTDVVSVSLAPVSPALFAIPKDYKKVAYAPVSTRFPKRPAAPAHRH